MQGLSRCRAHLAPPESGQLHLPESLTLRGLANAALCAKPEGARWHRLECLEGKCTACGVGRLALGHEAGVAVSWQQYGEVQHGNGKSTVLLQQRGMLAELVELVQRRLVAYIWHRYHHHWQHVQFRCAIDELQPGELVLSTDFSAVFTFERNEVQSVHWGGDQQLSLFVAVTYYLDPHSGQRVCESHHFWSSERRQDICLVQACLRLLVRQLRARDIPISVWHQWSDGCSGQFKSCHAFYQRTLYSGDCDFGMPVFQHFFASGHGKGTHDGEGGIVKRGVNQELLRVDGLVLQSVAQVVQWCTEHLSTPVKLREGAAASERQRALVEQRVFYEVSSEQINAELYSRPGAHTVPTHGHCIALAPQASLVPCSSAIVAASAGRAVLPRVATRRQLASPHAPMAHTCPRYAA